jgi:hypothetical protein
VNRFFTVGLLLLALGPLAPAQAAGGAHFVDDSETEIPGVCHVENWVALFFTGDRIFNDAPACTTKKIPWLEIGAAYNQYWDSLNAPLFGPAMKVNFRSETTGLGLGLGLNSGVNLHTGDLGFASMTMLVTLPVQPGVKFHANAGWSYLATGNIPNAVFYGAQFEIDISRDVMLMVEGFGRAPGFPGLQMGLRFTPDKGPVDFDLLVANYFDSTTSRFITLGVTVRF